MNTARIYRKFLSGVMVFTLALMLGAGVSAVSVYGASGTVYTCSITPCYAHPVTGEIEDSGGESGYATGQGMVEGALYTAGIIEVADTGEFYLTIRMGLMDFSSGHSFMVQNVGDSGWASPAMGVTGTGSDSNGGTSDFCIQVPSENCVVRGSMYVEPMGRDVIFYLYPSNYSEGNNTDMNATMVTSASGSDQAAQANTTTETYTTSDTATASNTAVSTPEPTAEPAVTAAATPIPTPTPTPTPEVTETQAPKETAAKLESTIEEAAVPETDAGELAENSALNGTRGLSLSTAGEAEADTEAVYTSAAGSLVGQSILVIVISITISGLILLGAAAGIVYLFRKNWKRWGGGDDDDY